MKISARQSYVDRKIFAMLLALALFSLTTAIIIIVVTSAMLDARQSGTSDSDIRTKLGVVSTQLSQAESAQRGYILTGNNDYLTPYTAITKTLPASLSSLTSSVAGTSYAAPETTVVKLANAKLGELSSTLSTYNTSGYPAALVAVNSNLGETLMSQFNDSVTRLQNQLTSDIAQARVTVSRDVEIIRVVGLLALAGTIILVVAVYILFEHALESERALDRAKDEFVSLASHQLRTPATGIKSILSMLAAGDFGALSDKQQSVVGKAVLSNERELGIIEELLNVAKADAGRLVLKEGQVEIMGLVDSILGEQHEAFRAKELTLKVKRPSERIELVADEEKLYMAISNLIDNARKYTPEQGNITVAVWSNRGHVLVEVTDSGIGIEEADLAHIFDRFQRARLVLAGSIEGTGLGLYLARRIAELHHGTIDVSSRRGHGSRFTMILPRQHSYE